MWPFRRQREDRAELTLGDVLAWDSPRTASGITVGADTALRLSAVWACTRLIADTVATLPVDAYRRGERTPLARQPAFLTSPAAYTPLPEWIAGILSCALLTGNGYGLVTARAGAAQRPVRVELLHPDRVGVQLEPDRATVQYRLDGREIDREDVVHIKAHVWPGVPTGLSPVRYAAETIGLGLAAQQFGARYFGDGSTPSGYLSSEQQLSPGVAADYAARWEAAHGGRRKTAVLGAGLEFRQIMVPPEESQFLETQRFTVQQIARLFGIPPEMIASDSGSSMTYANVEQRDLSLLKYAVGPWLRRLETLFDGILPPGIYAKFNVDALLRTDTKSRYEAHEIGLRAGFLTIDEVRAIEDLEPLPDAPTPPTGAVA